MRSQRRFRLPGAWRLLLAESSMEFHCALHKTHVDSYSGTEENCAPSSSTGCNFNAFIVKSPFMCIDQSKTFARERTPHPSRDLPAACDTYRRRAHSPSGTCDIQSRSCLMHAYQVLACSRIEACNTWTPALGSAVPDKALPPACATSCGWWNAHHGYALCDGVPLSYGEFLVLSVGGTMPMAS
jgi:hypothetical protein